MKPQKSVAAWAIVLVAAWMLVPRPDWTGAAEADAEQAASAPLQIVSYSDGRTGFFDPSTKRLFLYGADLRTPIMVVEVATLGQPLRLVQRTGR